MALSAFDDRDHPPTSHDLHDMLGRTAACWDELRTHLADRFAPLEEVWNFAGVKYGWSLRLKQKKRTILYLTPCRKHFLVGLVLGEKAVRAAQGEVLPESVLRCIEQAPKYAEGRGVRFEIRSKRDLAAIKDLAHIKMAH